MTIEEPNRILVTIENWNTVNDDTKRESTWEIRKHHLKQLKQILRKMYDHPQTEFRVKVSAYNRSST